MPGLEQLITQLVLWLKLGVETCGAAIIGMGVSIAVYQVVRSLRSPQAAGYYRIRLVLSRFLALALEFQLAADLLGTAVLPSWNQFGRLGAIAALRTALNYFLSREIRKEEKESESAPARVSLAEENAASWDWIRK